MPDQETPDYLPSRGGRILVVDDEPDVRESLDALLSMEGYAVDTASDAAEGWARFESAHYDLVLLDLMMPDRSGMEVLADIRERDRDTPVVIITAFGSIEVDRKSTRLNSSHLKLSRMPSSA